jgi:CBS domain-containing protein
VKGIPPIKAVMSAFPHSVDAGASVAEAARTMDELGIRHLAVVEGEQLVGLVREPDVRRALGGPPPGADARLGEGGLVQPGCVVDLQEPLDRVLLHMAASESDCALVVKKGRLVGIFTASDACRRFGELLQSLFPRGGDNAA